MSRDRLQYVPLSDLAEINPRKDVGLSGESTPVSFIPMGDVSESGTWVNRQTRPLGEVDSGYTSFKEGDVLFAKITPCMENGKGCHARNLVNGHGFGSTEFHVLRAIDGVSDARFLYHWTRTPMLRLKAESAMSGSAGQQRVSTWFFGEFKVPRIPLPEQRRIADVLDTVDAAIQDTDAVIEKQEQVKTGLLQDLLTRGLDAEGRLRDPEREPEAFRKTVLGPLPKKWKVGYVEDLAINHDNRRVPVKKAERDKMEEIYPYYGASGQIDWMDDYLYNGEFVLLGEDGENVRSRESRLAFKVTGRFWANNHAHVYEPRAGVDIDFLTELMEAKDYGPYVSGSAQPKITQTALKQIPFRVPPSEEQCRIGSVIRSFEKKSRDEGEYRGKLRQLKTGLMQDLLTGKMRVPEAEDRVDEVIA